MKSIKLLSPKGFLRHRMQWSPGRKEFFIWHVLPAIAITEEAITGAAARRFRIRAGLPAAAIPAQTAAESVQITAEAAAITAVPAQITAPAIRIPAPAAVRRPSAADRTPSTPSPTTAAGSVVTAATGMRKIRGGGMTAVTPVPAETAGTAVRIRASRSTADRAAR